MFGSWESARLTVDLRDWHGDVRALLDGQDMSGGVPVRPHEVRGQVAPQRSMWLSL